MYEVIYPISTQRYKLDQVSKSILLLNLNENINLMYSTNVQIKTFMLLLWQSLSVVTRWK